MTKRVVSIYVLLIAGALGLQAEPIGAPAAREMNLATAKEVVAAAVAEAAKKQAGGAIAVVDAGGQLVYFERLDETFLSGPMVSYGKARTAALFQKPTKVFEEAVKGGRVGFLAAPDMTPLQGGIPITSAGCVIGAIGVSGAHSAQEDEELAIAGAAAVQIGGPIIRRHLIVLLMVAAVSSLGKKAAAEDITFLPDDQVRSAFAKGMPLIEVGGYKIHASRREGPGMAEVHEFDTDIVYVLEGKATIVNGGETVDRKLTAPEEFRGASIRGGASRELEPGDVMVIPNGVPHWFQRVESPLLYYVVKVRAGGGER
jgi:glc operon protein GlcG